MRFLFQLGLLSLSLVALGGCNSAPKRVQAAVNADVATGQAGGQGDSQGAGRTELTPDIVFNVLAGEVATQRGELKQAYGYQLEVARLTGDAGAAEKATKIAIHLERADWAVAAVKEWVRLAPDEMPARQLAVVLMLREDRQARIDEQMKAIVAIGKSSGDNGFLDVIAALRRELKPEEARDRLRRLVNELGGDPDGIYALAVTALLDRDYAEAEAEARRLIDLHPDKVKAYLVLSRTFAAQSDKVEARRTLETAIGHYPDDPQLLAAYGKMLIEAKELSAAYDRFVRLKEIEPENRSALYWLGILALELEKKEEARGYFDTLFALKERAEVAAYYLGRIEESEQRNPEAIEWYRKVDRGEFSSEARMRAVNLMAKEGRLDEARDWLQSLRIQSPKESVQLYLTEVELLREHGSPEQVMELFDKALKAHSESEELLYSRGLFAVTQNRLDIMEQDLGKVIALNPKHADALNALGYTLADQTERYQDALELIQRALELSPDSAAILDSMGWVQYRLGNTEVALDYLQRAFRKLPDAEIGAHLGEVLWVMGEHEKADKVWQGVLEQMPESRHVLEAMRRLKK